MKNRDKLLAELLSRRDPQGFYVIVARREALEAVRCEKVHVELVGDLVIIRSRARNVAERLAKLLLRQGLLAQ